MINRYAKYSHSELVSLQQSHVQVIHEHFTALMCERDLYIIDDIQAMMQSLIEIEQELTARIELTQEGIEATQDRLVTECSQASIDYIECESLARALVEQYDQLTLLHGQKK
jgi:hypothetical protein